VIYIFDVQTDQLRTTKTSRVHHFRHRAISDRIHSGAINVAEDTLHFVLAKKRWRHDGRTRQPLKARQRLSRNVPFLVGPNKESSRRRQLPVGGRARNGSSAQPFAPQNVPLDFLDGLARDLRE
jgi:hypothetical protein